MTTFDRCEEAFENLFAHDEALQFKAKARRPVADAEIRERMGILMTEAMGHVKAA